MRILVLFAIWLQHNLARAAPKVAIVTGAMGKTGALVYKELKKRQFVVRGLVRNASKARDMLDCGACGEADGIFLGDVTKEETLVEPMKGTDILMILTSSVPICDFKTKPPACHYPEGAYPKDVDWDGTKNQIKAFASQNPAGVVMLCSSMGTTDPDNFLDKLGNGHTLYYKLNQEAFVLSSGLASTIVKPCGLSDAPAGGSVLVAGHDDALPTKTAVARADVAQVMAEAIARDALGLRFDLCTQPGGPPAAPTDFGKLLEAAKRPWQRQVHGLVESMV